MMSEVSDSDVSPKTTENRVEHLPRWLIVLAAALGLGYVGFVVLLWRLGLFDVPSEGPDAEIFAAVFALLGGLFGAILTFAAALLKHSLDTRTLELSRQTEARLRQENRQAEDRLRLDTAIRAVELLATPDGKKSPAVKQAGSLFALVQLGQIELAIALLSQTWPTDEVTTPAAMSVLDYALREDSANQYDAALLYRNNADKLIVDGGLSVPPCISEDWPVADIEYDARVQLLDGIVGALASRRRDEWESDDLLGLVVYLDRVRTKETSPRLKLVASAALAEVLAGVDTTLSVVVDEQTELALGPLAEEVQQAAAEATFPGVFSSIDALRAAWANAPG